MNWLTCCVWWKASVDNLVKFKSQQSHGPLKSKSLMSQVEESTEPAAEMKIREDFIAREDRTYLITGGLGGFGLALAVWLAGRGAKNLVLSSKRWGRRSLSLVPDLTHPLKRTFYDT